MTNDKTLAKHFKALAHPRRAMLFRLLSLRPEVGRSQKALLAASGLPYASFVHHMSRLESAGLVRSRAARGSVSYVVVPDALLASLAAAHQFGEIARRRVPRAA